MNFAFVLSIPVFTAVGKLFSPLYPGDLKVVVVLQNGGNMDLCTCTAYLGF